MGRTRVVLVCEQCGERNYKTTRKERGGDDAVDPGTLVTPLSLKKFCPKCEQHTLHQEAR